MRDVVQDTIVALATAEGTAGLSVVRLSGPDAIPVAQKVFSGPLSGSPKASHVAVYGILKSVSDSFETDSESIDQVLALPLLAPRSYTGEDTVEFFCHGGRVVSRQVVAACRQAGARPATAGEFTRRAFLNGKMSLDQAEAVADLIHAESRHSARAAIEQLLGGFKNQLKEIETPLLELLSSLEGSFEFLDEEEVDVSPEEMRQVLTSSAQKIDDLLALAPAGRLLRDGIQVVLTGPPNVGKSSLFNALLEEDRAIVDDEAGTTRDVVSGDLEKNGTRFVFHDTAGLRTEAGRVEKMGMGRTHQAAAEADIVLALFEEGTQAMVDDLASSSAVVIPVMTKADLAKTQHERDGTVRTSSADGRGLPELWAALFGAVESFRLNDAVTMGVVLNERHRHKLQLCRQDLEVLLEEVSSAEPGQEIVGTLLSSILSRFGEISGRVFSEQLLESIFSRFCVGK